MGGLWGPQPTMGSVLWEATHHKTGGIGNSFFHSTKNVTHWYHQCKVGTLPGASWISLPKLITSVLYHCIWTEPWVHGAPCPESSLLLSFNLWAVFLPHSSQSKWFRQKLYSNEARCFWRPPVGETLSANADVPRVNYFLFINNKVHLLLCYPFS